MQRRRERPERRPKWRERCEEAGATAIEYAIMASLIAVVIIASVQLVGAATRDNLCRAATEYPGSSTSADDC